MFCSNCGKEIKENSNFCQYCGYKVCTVKKDVTDINKSDIEQNIIECEVDKNLNEDNYKNSKIVDFINVFKQKFNFKSTGSVVIIFSSLIIGLFLYLHSFSYNLYEIDNGQYINDKGKIIFNLPSKYNIIGEYRDGYMIVGEVIRFLKIRNSDYEHGILTKLSIVNNRGDIKSLENLFVLPISTMEECIYVPVFKNGCVIVTQYDGKTVAINKNGNIIRNNNIKNIQKDTIVQSERQGCSILEDKSGNIIKVLGNGTSSLGYVTSEYSEGCMAVADIVDKDKITDNLEYMNKRGKTILKTKYHALYHYCTDWITSYDAGFHNGLALVKDDDDNFLYIDKKGNPVIKLKTKNCDPYNFRGKLAQIYYYKNMQNYKLSYITYINKKGEEVYKYYKYARKRPKYNLNNDNLNNRITPDDNFGLSKYYIMQSFW